MRPSAVGGRAKLLERTKKKEEEGRKSGEREGGIQLNASSADAKPAVPSKAFNPKKEAGCYYILQLAVLWKEDRRNGMSETWCRATSYLEAVGILINSLIF